MPATSPTLNQIAGGNAPMAVATMSPGAPTTTAGTASPAAWWQQELAQVPEELRRIGRERAAKKVWRKQFYELANEVLSSRFPQTPPASDRLTMTASPRRAPSRAERAEARKFRRFGDALDDVVGLPRRDEIIDAILATERPEPAPWGRAVSYYEAFAGGGLLGLGVEAAIIAATGRPMPMGFCEKDDDAAEAYTLNHERTVHRHRDIMEIADGQLGTGLTSREEEFIQWLDPTGGDDLHLLVGGPPCQAHSGARAHIASSADPRIDLYGNMVRLAEVAKPRMVLIENVAQAADNPVVQAAVRHLGWCGYLVTSEIVDAVDFGTPQYRQRYLVVGVRDDGPRIAFDFAGMRRNFGTRHHGAIEALRDSREDPARPWTMGGARHGLTGVQARWIARNPGRSLPWSLAPPRQRLQCKAAWGRTYQRMDGREPSDTLTRYFGSPANGRYLHPYEERGLSVEEGLRLQGVPAWYRMPADIPETSARLITANGAPPQLGVAVVGQAIEQGILRV